MPGLFFPGQAGQAEALKPWKQHRPPVPPQLCSLPGLLSWSLQTSWGAGPAPAARVLPARAAAGPQRAQQLLAVQQPSHAGSVDPATKASFLCYVHPPFSSLSPLGPRKEAGSGK